MAAKRHCIVNEQFYRTFVRRGVSLSVAETTRRRTETASHRIHSSVSVDRISFIHNIQQQSSGYIHNPFNSPLYDLFRLANELYSRSVAAIHSNNLPFTGGWPTLGRSSMIPYKESATSHSFILNGLSVYIEATESQENIFRVYDGGRWTT